MVVNVKAEELDEAIRDQLETYNAELTVLRIDDILRAAAGSREILSGTAYTLTVLLDGARFLEISGNIG